MLATYKGAVNRSTLGYCTFHSVIVNGLPLTCAVLIQLM